MRLLTVEEVAEILGVAVRRTYELARTGLLPSVRLGRQVRFDEDALRRFIDSGGRTLGDEPSAPRGTRWDQ